MCATAHVSQADSPFSCDRAEFGDGTVAPDGRERAVVAVDERSRRAPAMEPAQDGPGHEPPLLLGHGRQAGQRLAVSSDRQGGVADHEDVAVAGERAGRPRPARARRAPAGRRATSRRGVASLPAVQTLVAAAIRLVAERAPRRRRSSGHLVPAEPRRPSSSKCRGASATGPVRTPRGCAARPRRRMMRAAAVDVAEFARAGRRGQAPRSSRPSRRRSGRPRPARTSAAAARSGPLASRAARRPARIVRRISSASSSVLRPGAASAQSSWPK